MHLGTEDLGRECLGWSSGGNREGRLLSVLHHLENNSTRLRMRGREARARGKGGAVLGLYTQTWTYDTDLLRSGFDKQM